MSQQGTPPGRRAAVVDGLRTPFVKAGTDFKGLASIDLAALLVNELVVRSGIPPSEFDLVTFGEVIPSTTARVEASVLFITTMMTVCLPFTRTAFCCTLPMRRTVATSRR